MNVKDFLESQRWIFAKTYAQRAPHEYCLKEKVVGSEEDFVEAVKTIQNEGFPAKFWGHPNTYLHVNGHMYWVMWPVAEEAILINRSNVDDYDINITLKKKGQ